MSPLLCVIASVLLTAAAQIFLKLGTRHTGPLTLMPGVKNGYMLSALFEKHIWAWFLLNGLALWLYLTALAKVDLSYAYPFISLNYVLVPTLSIYFFDERVRPRQWLGIASICLGVILIAIN